MSGLIGVVKTANFSKNTFQKAIDSIIYGNFYIKDHIYENQILMAGRAHLGIIELSSPFFYNEKLVIWIEGELYNKKKLEFDYNQNFTDFYSLLSFAHEKNLLDVILSKIDGYFCAVIYDIEKQKISLISDRYGLKPLYFNEVEFAWSSELKSFKYLSKNVTLNYSAINCFLDLGHFLNDATYFNEITILDAATIAEYDIKEKTVKKRRYWYWSLIEQNKDISFEECKYLLFDLLQKSLEKRIQGKNKEDLGITLSGGVDSRVMLSLCKEKLPTITFGCKNCMDEQIAEKVSSKNRSPHYFFELDSGNWFKNRIESIWKTDGMTSVMHMHSAPFVDTFSSIFRLNISGFSGDLNIGGGWINKLNKRISKESALQRFPVQDSIKHIDSKFYDINHEDPFYIDQRVRRFTTGGSMLLSKTIEQVKPFMDNDLMEFIYSLPDEYRFKSKLYYEMIKTYLPNLFTDIPTTHDIIPIHSDNITFFKLKIKLSHLLMKLYLKKQYQWTYTDYGMWQHLPDFVIFLKNNNLYNLKRSIVSDIIKYEKYKQTETLFNVLTVEIWLRQYFDLWN